MDKQEFLNQQEDPTNTLSLDERTDVLRVVECPSCYTCFALPPKNLVSEPNPDDTDSQNPNLHCSKCDKLFELRRNSFYGSKNEYILASNHEPIIADSDEDKITEEEETIDQVVEDLSLNETEESLEDDSSISEQDLFQSSLESTTASVKTEDEDLESTQIFEDDDKEEQDENIDPQPDEIIEPPSFDQPFPRASLSPSEQPFQENLFSLFQTKSHGTASPQPIKEHSDRSSTETAISEIDEPSASSDFAPLFSAESEILRETRDNIEEEENLTEDKSEDGEEIENTELVENKENEFVEELHASEEETVEEEFSEDALESPKDEDLAEQEQEQEQEQVLAESEGVKVIDLQVTKEEFEDATQTSEIIYAQANKTPTGISPGTSVLFLASPIIGFVLLLYGFGHYIQQEGNEQNIIRQVASTNLPEVAPPSVLLQGVSYHRHMLRSGGEMFSVDALLKNNDRAEFSKINIQAALFDINGIMVASKNVAVGRQVNTKSGLTTEADVLTFQEQFSKRENTLAPGQKKQVSIFFTSDEARKAKYFTARIYSVIR